jgi:hypothetical protein
LKNNFSVSDLYDLTDLDRVSSLESQTSLVRHFVRVEKAVEAGARDMLSSDQIFFQEVHSQCPTTTVGHGTMDLPIQTIHIHPGGVEILRILTQM